MNTVQEIIGSLANCSVLLFFIQIALKKFLSITTYMFMALDGVGKQLLMVKIGRKLQAKQY